MRDDSHRINERKARAINSQRRGKAFPAEFTAYEARAQKSGVTGRVTYEMMRTQTIGEVNQGVSILQTDANILLLDTFSIFTVLRRAPG